MRKSKTGTLIDKTYLKLHLVRTPYKKSRYALKRVKMINGGYNGTKKEFREVVIPYWERFGIIPKKYWYDLYCDGQNRYNPRYIPDSLWYTKILPYFNNPFYKAAYSDKGTLDHLYFDLKRPRTITKKVATRYYDGDMNLVTRDESIKLCMEAGQFVIKGSTNSGSGRDVKFYDCGQTSDRENIGRLFDSFEDNFIIQAILKQHPDMARLHPKSLNTIRVQSFFFKNDVHILSAQLRIGDGDSRVDNVSAGGFACNLDITGKLSSKAVNRKSEWIDTLPNGITLRDITVPSIDKLFHIVKKKHSKLPYFGLIGWDFAIDDVGDPVFIEINIQQEQNQIGSKCPTFGDLTDEVLQDVFITQSLKNAFFI